MDRGQVIIRLDIRAPKNFTNPVRTRCVDTVPYMDVYSWEEEIVLVAAHELRHAEQFLAECFTGDQVTEAETDAELFAGAVLDAYRQKHLTAK